MPLLSSSSGVVSYMFRRSDHGSLGRLSEYVAEHAETVAVLTRKEVSE